MRHRMRHALASLALIAAAIWLERSCRVPEQEDDEDREPGDRDPALPRIRVIDHFAFDHRRRHDQVRRPLRVIEQLVGAVGSRRERDQVAGQVADARAKGATVRCGGDAPGGPGFFYRPTVLTEVTTDMKVLTEEVFGPVATVEPVADVDEAIAVANRTQYGLGASV